MTNKTRKLNVLIALVIVSFFTSCSDDEDSSQSQQIVEVETTLANLDSLDKQGRWLANGIQETNDLNKLMESQKATITNYLNDLAENLRVGGSNPPLTVFGSRHSIQRLVNFFV